MAHIVGILLLSGSVGTLHARDVATITLQLKWKHQFQFAGYYAAIDKGYYQEAGLDVSLLEPGADGKDPVEKVLNGTAHFGIGTSDLVLRHGRGQPVVALATIFQHSPLVLLTTEERGIDNLHELIGKRVAIEPQSGELFAYLKAEKIAIRSLEIVPHKYDVDDLVAGEIAAVSGYLTDELYSLRQAGVTPIVFNPRSSGIDFYGDTLFTSQSLVKQRPDVVQAFLSATMRGWRYAFDHQEEMVNLIYNQYSKRHSQEHLRFEAEQMRRLVLPDIVELGYMNEGRWNRIAEHYVELGLMPSGKSLDGFLYNSRSEPIFSKYVVTSFLAIALLAAAGIAIRIHTLNKKLTQAVAERSYAVQQITALEKKSRYLIDNVPTPLVVSDIETAQVLHSNSFAKNLFRDMSDGEGQRNTTDWWVNLDAYEAGLAVLRSQGYIYSFEAELKTRDEKRFWGAISATIIELDGKPAVISAVTDITHLKKTEEEMLRNQRRFRIMADAVPAAVAHIGRNNKIIFANRTCREWFDISSAPGDNAWNELRRFKIFQLSDEVLPQLQSGETVRFAHDEYLHGGQKHHLDTTYIPFMNPAGDLDSWFMLITDVTRWKDMELRLQSQAQTDELTGLSNRRHLYELGTQEIARSKRFERFLSLILLDIDRFKQTNDNLGHEAGDNALRALATILRRECRSSDIIARTGGEEFVVILPETGLADAVDLAERLRQEVQAASIVTPKTVLRITISAGVASLNESCDNLDSLMRCADEAMYRAKARGRNRVEVWEEDNLDLV